MGKQPTPAFYGLSIFIILLYSTEVSSAAVPLSISTVMKNDAKLCDIPFLNGSDVTKSCAKVNYPEGAVTLDYTTLDIFLCLGVYDAWYKLCQYQSPWKNQFDSTAAFNSYLEKLSPGDDDAEESKFCESIKDIKPMYDKIEPVLSPFMKRFNSTFACHSSCFAFDGKFNPLCAVLAWIKNVDTEVQKRTMLQQSSTIQSAPAKKINDTITMPALLQNTETNVPNAKAAVPKGRSNPIEHTNVAAPNKEKQSVTSNDNADKVAPEAHEVPTKKKPLEPSNQAALAETPKTEQPKNQISIPNAGVPGSDPSKDISVDDTARLSKKTEAVRIPPASTINADKDDSPKVTNEDVKTSTISEHTQDLKDPSEDDLRMENEGIPFDADDIDPPADMIDQNQNRPEPSEQRDILPRFHSMRPEDESHFFAYFTVVSLVCIAAYIGYHNKQKILAIVLEGRRSRSNRGRRRPSTASYRKLDCTLEEAVTSQCNANVTHVIY